MKIIVLCGGTGTEREVSLNSGAAVQKGLAEAGYDAPLEDVTSIRSFIEKWPSLGADGAFIALHGGWGEDGRIQAAFDACGIPYTGSGARACMLAMDKRIAIDVLTANGVPTPPGIAVTHDRSHTLDLRRAVGAWGKIVIKPASGGSTVGVTITGDPKEARDGLIAVWDIDTRAVVEKYIPGRELTVAVIGGPRACFAMPAIEIRPRSGFYDYGSKYTKGMTEYLCPAPLKPKTAANLAKYACAAHMALGCRAYSRVDFRVTDDGEIFALEANTAPGMTETSLVPKACAAYGWNFPQLLDRIVRDSFAARSA